MTMKFDTNNNVQYFMQYNNHSTFNSQHSYNGCCRSGETQRRSRIMSLENKIEIENFES